MHRRTITLKFPPAELPLHEAILRYATAEDVKPEEAVKRLCIQGLRVPRLIGSPPPRVNPIDELLEGVLPKGPSVERKQMRAEIRGQIAEEPQPPVDVVEPEPAAPNPADPLPLLGYPEVDTLLRDHFAEQNREKREAAKAGLFDDLLSELDDDIAEPSRLDSSGDAEPARSVAAEPPPPPAPSPGREAAEPYDVMVRNVPTTPVRVVEPETGIEMVVTPQRAMRESDLANVDAQLHAHAAQAPPKPRAAPVSDLLMGLIQAQNIRR